MTLPFFRCMVSAFIAGATSTSDTSRQPDKALFIIRPPPDLGLLFTGADYIKEAEMRKLQGGT
jgi:hypothetical protein